MFFELTEEQQLVQETARRFAEEEILPTLEEEEKITSSNRNVLLKWESWASCPVFCLKNWAAMEWVISNLF